MARMTGFIFQDEYFERLAKLSDQEVGRLVRALATYHATGETQELAGRESIAFDFIKADIDRIDEKYEAKCQTNRNNRAQSGADRNGQEPPLTIVNDRQRPSTESNDRPQVIVKDKENILTTTTTARAIETPFGVVDVDPLIVKIQAELNGLTDTHYQRLEDYRQSLGDELVGYAIDEAVGNGVRNWSYVEAILRGLEQAGVRTIGEAKALHEKRKEGPKNRQNGGTGKVLNAQRFQQRDYSEDDMRGTSLEIFQEAEALTKAEGTAAG